MKNVKLLRSVPFIALALMILARSLSNAWINKYYFSIVTILLLCSLVSFFLLRSRINLNKKMLLGASLAITLIIIFVQLF
jgi:hypothetical protein